MSESFFVWLAITALIFGLRLPAGPGRPSARPSAEPPPDVESGRAQDAGASASAPLEDAENPLPRDEAIRRRQA